MTRNLWIVVAVAIIVLFALVLSAVAWDNTSPYYGWADKQLVMPAARPRFSCGADSTCSCCNGAEIIKTRFRVALDASDAWDWLNPLKNKWERVPSDIIHWGEPTPDKQAVMFVYPIGSDTPRCFFPPQEGGG